MDWQLAALCALTFLIHLIGTLAYAVRIAGVRTRRIAVSFALFNVLVLVSRTANSFQGPFLARRIEGALHGGAVGHLLADFRWLLLSIAARNDARPDARFMVRIRANSVRRMAAPVPPTLASGAWQPQRIYDKCHRTDNAGNGDDNTYNTRHCGSVRKIP
jgi:hypothetical protein